MAVITTVLIGLVAALHIYFLALEMLLWDTPYGRRVFGSTPEFSKASKVLASNQGLYNGFLAAGLIWSLLDPHSHAFELKIFFLTCVIVAGVRRTDCDAEDSVRAGTACRRGARCRPHPL